MLGGCAPGARWDTGPKRLFCLAVLCLRRVSPNVVPSHSRCKLQAHGTATARQAHGLRERHNNHEYIFSLWRVQKNGDGIMTRGPLLAAVMVVVAGCATLRGSGGPSPESELERGVAAARAQDFSRTREILEPLYRAHYMDEIGHRALLVLTAAELDPRNSARRLYAAADYAGSLLNSREIAAYQVPIAESLYLLSQELGGHEEELARAEAEKQQAQSAAAAADRRASLRSNREPWPTQVAKLREANEDLKKKVDQLQGTVAKRDKDLAEAKEELERIKKTLKIK
jgi:hypothetical protein